MKGTGFKFIYITAALVVAVILFSGSNIRTIFKLRNQIKRYEQRLEELAAENQRLLQEIRLVENEQEHLEYLARKRLGLIKPGEIKYYIIESTITLP